MILTGYGNETGEILEEFVFDIYDRCEPRFLIIDWIYKYCKLMKESEVINIKVNCDVNDRVTATLLLALHGE